MNCSNGARGIGPSSSCFALRQNGSFVSLKSRSIIVRLLPEVDVRDVSLRLEGRPHERRQPRVDVEHFLKLVEHERDRAPAFGGQLGRQLEDPLQRRVDILGGVTGGEAERHRAVVGIERHHRSDPESPEELRRTVARPQERAGDVLVDRRGQLRGELLLRRGLHQIHLRDQDALPRQLLRRPEDERRLAVPARGEDDDVEPVADVRLELTQLVVPVGERRVEGEIAEVERIPWHRLSVAFSALSHSLLVIRLTANRSRAYCRLRARMSGTVRVLVVEDEQDLADAIAAGLRREGYAVDLAHGGDEALVKARVYPYDLICLDLNLPELGGREVCRGFAPSRGATGSPPRILMLTARAGVDDRIAGLDDGAELPRPAVRARGVAARARARCAGTATAAPRRSGSARSSSIRPATRRPRRASRSR